MFSPFTVSSSQKKPLRECTGNHHGANAGSMPGIASTTATVLPRYLAAWAHPMIQRVRILNISRVTGIAGGKIQLVVVRNGLQ
jgi:hypothetical protein